MFRNEAQSCNPKGNQGHSGYDIRRVCKWIWAGTIGEVKEVHAWTDRPIWPQGFQRPIELMKTPKTLDWDSRFDREYEEFNAKQLSEEWINHTYRDGWSLPAMPRV